VANTIRWWPGSDATGETSDIDALLQKACDEHALVAVTGASLGGGSGSGDWWLNDIAFVQNGAQPYLQLQWIKGGGDTYQVRLRYSSSLQLSQDPSYLFAAQHTYPTRLSSAISMALCATWQTRLGGTTAAVVTALNKWSGALQNLFAGTTAFVLAHSCPTLTDGANAGKIFAFVATATYNPSTSELAAGIKQLDMRKTGLLSDGGDSTLNCTDGAAVVGSAINEVPTIVLEGGAAADAWNTFSSTINTTIQETSFTSNTFITNNGDLGADDHPATEPSTTHVDVFASPGLVPVIVGPTAPSIFTAITTLPAAIFAGFLALGSLASEFAGAGIVATAVGAFEAVIALLEKLERIAAAMERIATSTEYGQGTELTDGRIVD